MTCEIEESSDNGPTPETQPMMVNRNLAIYCPAIALSLALTLLTGCNSPAVSDSALGLARQRLLREVGQQPKKGTLVVVDYTKPSSEKRMTVVDLKSGRTKMNTLVAHGVNSGLLYATSFSDRMGSEQSSLGLYQVSEEFNGKHGPSLRLDGLDPGFNLNARKRGIIVHSANYVSQETMRQNRHEWGRLGRSQGCLALSDKDMAKLDRKLVRPAYVFAYAPPMLAQNNYPHGAPAPATQPEIPSTAPVLASNKSQPAKSKEAARVKPLLVSQTQQKPLPQPQPASDLPAIPRPSFIETGPVPMTDNPELASFYTYSAASNRN
jgi:hypothetical protein